MSSKRFNISIPDDLADRIDEEAKRQGRNRSDFIRDAVRQKLARLQQWQALAKKARTSYQGPVLDEDEVAEVVRSERSQ